MKIYTKTGDKGYTSLVGGERVEKDDPRVMAYGSVDEVIAVVAYLRDSMDATEPAFDEYREDLRGILNTLMNVAAILAMGSEHSDKVPPIGDDKISYLEGRIDYINVQLKPIERFVLPGGHPLVSLAHMCRTVCRRAERMTVRAAKEFDIEPNAQIYLNRLSDYLYQLSRKLADDLDVAEEYWIP
jgi:cob(I)alamin adenosyltransferase